MNVSESFRVMIFGWTVPVVGVHGRGQRDGAVADVLELPTLDLAGADRAGGALAGAGLHAGLLVHAEQHRVRGPVQVEPAHRLGLGVKRRVGGPAPPAADPVGFDVERGEDHPRSATR